jgi:hypothetical protein
LFLRAFITLSTVIMFSRHFTLFVLAAR